MAKYTHDSVLDAALTKVATATRLVATSAQPANYAGIAAVALADVALTPGDGNGDFAISDGDLSGRKLTVSAHPGVAVDATGGITHLCLDDGSTLLHVTTSTVELVTSGFTVNLPAYVVEFLDVVP